MKKGTRMFLIIIVLLLLCGVSGAGGWYLGVKYANKEDSKRIEEKKEEPKKEEPKKEEKPKPEQPPEEKPKEEEGFTKEELGSIPTLSFPKLMCGGTNFDLQEKTVYAKDISDEDKLTMLAGVLLEFNKAKVPDIDYYDEEGFKLDFDIKEVAKKYFDLTPSIEKLMNRGFSNDESSFVYENNKSLYYYTAGGCEGHDNGGNELVYRGQKKDGNTIIKSYYYYYSVVLEDFYEEELPDGTTLVTDQITVYKNKNDKKPVYEKVLMTDELDLSNFNTYDMYFDTTGGNMKLIKIVFNKK